MANPIRILVVGVGNMGQSHALAYDKLDGFEVVGLMSRTIRSSREKLAPALQRYPVFDDFEAALRETRPDAVSINTYPNTHASYALRAMDFRLPCLHGKADRHHDRGRRSRRRQGPRHEPQARPRLHPPRPPRLGQAGRARPHPRQAPRHAHEPEPAVLGPGLDLAQEPDGEFSPPSSTVASTMST